MSKKEYEMDDDYKKAAAFLVEQIAERDKYAEHLKQMPPEARPEGLRLLAELDKAIERGEQSLADEYDAYQKMRRLEDERDRAFDEVTERMAGAYVHVKYRNPEILAQMEEIINKMPPEESEAFYECAARHEAGDLVKIIRREGETREEAEEFLKNFRIEEEKERAALFEEFVEKFSGKYVQVKYRQPEMRKEFDEVISELEPEQIKAFHDVTDYLEAHYLIECITVEGETREQTEEFLKNYRAAEGK